MRRIADSNGKMRVFPEGKDDAFKAMQKTIAALHRRVDKLEGKLKKFEEESKIVTVTARLGS